MKNVLTVTDRNGFRQWLQEHPDEKECWLTLKRGKPVDPGTFYYLDAVEEALCFGWIDSTVKEIDGVKLQRFSPRQKNSPWTELNKERVRRLERMGLMTDRGRVVLPAMGPRSFVMDPDIVSALKANRVWGKFQRFPALYQRVRAYNVSFHKKRDSVAYEKALKHLIDATRAEQTYGEWNDYGRLLENLLPRDKHDDSTIRDLLALSDDEITPLLPELLTWLQDMNWPVSGPVKGVLGKHWKICEPFITDVLKGSDEVWKYNILASLIYEWPALPGKELAAEIRRIADHPTSAETEDEVDEVAKAFLNALASGNSENTCGKEYVHEQRRE